MSLPRLAVSRPVTTTMFFIAVTLLGLFSFSRLAIDLIPEVSFPSLTISTSYSGAAPEEVERLVTIPIEQAVSTVSGVTSMESVSQEGSSRVTLRFEWGTDLEAAANEVRANVERARSRLPSEADAPRVFRFNPNQMPIMTLALSGDMEQAALRRLAEEEFTYYLERLEGVAAVDVIGGPRREIRVQLDPTRAQAYGVTIDQVVSSIRAENFNAPAGRVVVGQAQFSLRTQGRLTSVNDLETVLVARRDGVQTLLRDVATIEQVDDDEGMLVRVDGRPGILMSIQKQSGANTVQVADAVLAALDDLRLQYPQVSVRPINDSSVFIRRAIANVVQSAIFGGFLAAAILLLFLRSVRATLVVGVAIPVSIVASFILIERAGMTLNTMSLGGLALGIGMLLDNSIVVLENIYRHRSLGKDPRTAAMEGTQEMAMAITASTLTTLAVFLPMMFLAGMTGILFRQLSLMVAFSITCSLLVALTLLPVMASRLMAAGQAGGTGFLASLDRRLEALFHKGEEGYGGLLQRAVKKPGWVALGALVLLAVSLGIFQSLGTELLPATDEGQVGVFLSLPAGTRLEVTDAVARRVEAMVREAVPELQHMEVRVGSGGFGGRGTHSANITLSLVPKQERERSTREVVNRLREELSVLPGVNIRVTERSNFVQRLASGGLGGGGAERISLNLLGNDLDLMRETAQDLQALLSDIPGLVNVQIARDEDQPEFVVRVDRERAADLGLTATQVARAVQTAVQGQVATDLHINGRDYPVRVSMMTDPLGPSPAEIEAIPIHIGGGEFVPLASVGALVQEDAPAAIARLDQQRAVRLTVSTDGIDLGSAVAAVREAVAAYGLPDGITVHYGGEYEEQQRAFRELLLVLALAVSLVYLVMASQFESLLDPFIIMFSVPVALPGVVLALWLTGTPLTTQAYMGLIMLGGIVVNNAIVLVDYVNLLRRQGMPLDQAVVTGARTRLRPVLMTTGTTVLGLLPLALELGEGAELQSPLARAVIGGLIMSTMVTLVLIPTIYRWVHGLRERRKVQQEAAVVPAPGTVLPLVVLLSLVLWEPAPALAQGATAPTSPPVPSALAPPAAQDAPLPPVLSLDQAIALALEGNLSLQQARARLEAAQSRLREVEAEYRPGLNLDGQWSIQEPLSEARERARQEGAVLSLEARQVIPTGQWFGRPHADLELARLTAQGALRAWEDAREGVVLNTLRAYIHVLKAQAAWELAQKALQRAEEFLRETQLMYRQGMASELDVGQAEARRLAAQSALNSALRRLQLARARFNQEIGQPLDWAFQLQPWPEQAEPGSAAGSTPRTAREAAPSPATLEQALERRLDVYQARLSYQQVRWQVENRAYQRGPSFSITGGVQGFDGRLGVEWDSRDRDTLVTVTGDIARSGDDPRSGPGSSSSGRRSQWDVRVGVRWPLFDGGRDQEAARQDQLQLEQALLQVHQAEREARVAVYDRYFALLEAREREAVAELEREVARERLERVQARVDSGAAGSSDLLDAELSFWQAEQALQEARWDLRLAEAEYRRALGLPVWAGDGAKHMHGNG